MNNSIFGKTIKDLIKKLLIVELTDNEDSLVK